MKVSPEFIALVVFGVLMLGNYFGLWARLGFKNQSVSDAAAELAIRESTIERLVGERDKARAAQAALEATRSLEPLAAQLQASLEIEKQVLDRLAHHNGSFAHMETSMKELVATIKAERARGEASTREMTESLRLLTGFVAALVELPQKKES